MAALLQMKFYLVLRVLLSLGLTYCFPHSLYDFLELLLMLRVQAFFEGLHLL